MRIRPLSHSDRNPLHGRVVSSLLMQVITYPFIFVGELGSHYMRCGPDHSDEESFYADSTFEELQVKKTSSSSLFFSFSTHYLCFFSFFFILVNFSRLSISLSLRLSHLNCSYKRIKQFYSSINNLPYLPDESLTFYFLQEIQDFLIRNDNRCFRLCLLLCKYILL